MGPRTEATEQEILTKDNKGVNIRRYSRLIERVNQNVHGDYETSLRIKRAVLGRIVGTFKTWLPMSIVYRFGEEEDHGHHDRLDSCRGAQGS